MAGLESLDETQPLGSQSLADGDNYIRETRQKTKASFNLEHHLNGKHAIPMGTIVTRPAPDASEVGTIYLQENENGSFEIVVWDGTQWVLYTSNQQTASNTTAISSHKISDPIDHANASIAKDHLKSGLLVKRHFIDGSNDNSLVSGLVDGSVTTLHTHPTQTIPYPESVISLLPNKELVASGTSDVGWTGCGNGISNILPNGCRAVILEAEGVARPDREKVQDGTLTPVVKIAQGQGGNNNYEFNLIKGKILYSNIYSGIEGLGFSGQGIFSVNSSKKFSYFVNDFNVSWSINLVGYII